MLVAVQMNPRVEKANGKQNSNFPYCKRALVGVTIAEHAMSPLEILENNVSADKRRIRPAYVPPLERTKGQPPPIAANGGLSYMAFEREGDAGTAAALTDAVKQIADGE